MDYQECDIQEHIFTLREVALGGLVVIVLVIGPKIRGFKPGRIRGTPSFGGEVKPSVPCRKILRHVKDPYGV
jgi:hypothetical protein